MHSSTRTSRCLSTAEPNPAREVTETFNHARARECSHRFWLRRWPIRSIIRHSHEDSWLCRVWNKAVRGSLRPPQRSVAEHWREIITRIGWAVVHRLVANAIELDKAEWELRGGAAVGHGRPLRSPVRNHCWKRAVVAVKFPTRMRSICLALASSSSISQPKSAHEEQVEGNCTLTTRLPLLWSSAETARAFHRTGSSPLLVPAWWGQGIA